MTHPTLAPEPDTDADATFRNWMRLNLARAAETFGLSVTAAPVFGWRLRSIGAVAHGPNGPCWLRVVSEQPQWATGEFWTGNQDADPHRTTQARRPREHRVGRGGMEIPAGRGHDPAARATLLTQRCPADRSRAVRSVV